MCTYISMYVPTYVGLHLCTYSIILNHWIAKTFVEIVYIHMCLQIQLRLHMKSKEIERGMRGETDKR
jgi:hypothetical protein